MFQHMKRPSWRLLLAPVLLAAAVGIAMAQDTADDAAPGISPLREEFSDDESPPESEVGTEPRGTRPSDMPPLPPVPEAKPLKPAPSWDEFAEEDSDPGRPITRVRVAVLNATGKQRGAGKVALMLEPARRRPLENRMGLKIEVVNIEAGTAAAGEGYSRSDTVVFYRPGFLRPALILAQAIPGQTLVESMRPESAPRAGIDVEVVVNRALP